MAVCPRCAFDSKKTPGMQIEALFVATPWGKTSLAGNQLKTTARIGARLSCPCGWYIDGFVSEDGAFYGISDTQHRPDENLTPPADSSPTTDPSGR